MYIQVDGSGLTIQEQRWRGHKTQWGMEDLYHPLTPSSMTLREFGQRVMRWGSGDTAARARISTLTREELERAGLTREMAADFSDL